ncbi:hypothetical protein LCI18_009549 [Fusarium solani-melongenae]|uniref:Uncharacterized protein n=1 Tax=Fusarium solani subsp. cucurbitae TaxID=2747967 RepID=A0ACD3ZBI8_FUSSC|nr:hypothetical protein LCI18_009549 [Fusarium solani-melongenae]
MASTAVAQTADSVPKHRACDECRSRKLACSKEPDGCSRCKKEGILCHYSPQKPMGRPRKRRHVESEAPLPPAQDVSGPGTTGLTFAHGFHDQAHDYPPLPSDGFDQGLGFLDESASSNLEFWDLLPNNYLDTLPTDPQLLQHDAPATQKTSGGPPLTLSGVDLLGTISFDEPDLSQALASKDINASLQQYMADQLSPRQTHDHSNGSTPPDSTLGSDHGTSVGSTDDNATIPPPPSLRSVPTVPCGCLSSLYLALDSLTRLPDEVIPAMRVARNASKIAHDVIECSVCSKPLIDEPTKPPPIQCFQNLMLIGTLVPSACNAYATILEMVDAETAAAKKHGRSFWFSFKDIGGLWGRVGDNAGSCSVIENYNNKSMEPDMWRLTIRGLLRLDVYGLDETGSTVPKNQRFSQPGLRDVVKQLEERSRKRHEILDALIAAGHLHDGVSGVIYPSKPCTPEQRTCVKVLETARIALDNLVIA